MTEDELKKLVAAAKKRYDALSPEERRAHDEAQKQSWVRGMLPTGDPRFDSH